MPPTLSIRYWRKKRGKTLEWLGERVGRSHGVVGKWERGEIEPPAKMIIKVAEALDISPGSLFHERHGAEAKEKASTR